MPRLTPITGKADVPGANFTPARESDVAWSRAQLAAV